ncbi:hypothetical protein [Bacillus sp. EAC]|uniref:hypothetical protein n=1 Tax=Bacillus sp. EAC TaxID=1978338 RepID=UPI000B43146C|nr:hypothetical protein [Bacillus sp. EAC]
MNELNKITDEFIKSKQGIYELEELLSEVDIENDSLSKIEQKVFSKINKKKKKKINFKSKLFIYSAAAVFLISSITYKSELFRAWASEYLTYLPLINESIDNKSGSSFYEFDSYIGDHKNFKINNLAFNNELPYFLIEYEYDTKKKNEGEDDYSKFYKYWDSKPVHLKINNKLYDLKREIYGVGSDGVAEDQLVLVDKSIKLEKPSNNIIQFILGKNNYQLKLKEVDKVYSLSKSNSIKNVELKTMVKKEKNNLLINYLIEEEISPFNFNRSKAYLVDSKGRKSYLTSNENSSAVRYKYKAKTSNLNLKTVSLITPSISRQVTFNNLNWNIPIPSNVNEEIVLQDLILPGTNIKIEGAKVRRDTFAKNSIEIVMPKRNKNDSQWLLQLDIYPLGNQQFEVSAYSNKSGGMFEPDGYTIELKDLKQKNISLNITSASIIENGPWKTDLSNIK